MRRSLRRSAHKMGLVADSEGDDLRASVNSTTMKVMMALQVGFIVTLGDVGRYPSLRVRDQSFSTQIAQFAVTRARQGILYTDAIRSLVWQKDLMLMQQKRMLDNDETVSAVDEKVRLEYRQLEKAIDKRQGVIAGLAFVSLVLGS